MSSKTKTAVKKSASTPSALNSMAGQGAKSGGLSVFKQANGKASSGLTVVKVDQAKLKQLAIEASERFLSLDESEQETAVDDFLTTSETKNRKMNLESLVIAVKNLGVYSDVGFTIIQKMINGVEDANARENTLIMIQLLTKEKQVTKECEPFLLPLMPKLFNLHVDKVAAVRDSAAVCSEEIARNLCPQSFRLLYPMLVEGMDNENWKIRCAALNILKIVSPLMPQQLSPLLPSIIPRVSECILDSKKQVQTAGLEALVEACHAITNDDIRPLVPQLVSVIARPEESIATLNLLLETTFVAAVDSSVLALLAPLLGKSLRNRSSAMKRKAAKVIDIMCRLVQRPADVAPFKDMLLPFLEKVIDELVDEEVCEVAKTARDVLLKALGEGEETPEDPLLGQVSIIQSEVVSQLQSLAPLSAAGDGTRTGAVFQYVSELCTNLILFDAESVSNEYAEDGSTPETTKTWRHNLALTTHMKWKQCTVPYLDALLRTQTPYTGGNGEPENTFDGDQTPATERKSYSAEDSHTGDCGTENAEELSMKLRTLLLADVPDCSKKELSPSDLCDIEFSLAYGGKILLQNTYLRLGRGHRYGVMGKNGAGKTTLLTNIGTGNIEGFPPELKTVYVQHDDSTPDGGVPLVEELVGSKDLAGTGVTQEEAAQALTAIQFTQTMLESPRSCLSGGWKMKLLIVKAMLAKADILLLDEPTNHLDAASVQWLANYLNSLDHVTCLIVSHDTLFMDQVLTDVIHYEGKNLVYYPGNLTHFVGIHPEAKYYFELEGSSLAFKFPVPCRLEGINSLTRAVLKVDNVTFTYPGASKPTLVDVSVKVCLGSRIAVLGANGAGKSTLIKLMVQETKPDGDSGGSVWKHQNLNIAYVAQHSLHHVEEHLDSSPVDYIKWRFHGGVDKEKLDRPDIKLTEEEVSQQKTDRKYGDVLEVVGRRKHGHTMEYECTFVGQIDGREPNKYIPLEKMLEMGLSKQVQQCDEQVIARAAGLEVRPLLTAEIQGHLNDFNLDAEFGTHSTIRRLSGGQKVKLVLAAALWNCPHILVLDEPTNYLDREALGALTQAIKDFHGGVVIISHNKEFTDAICNETWFVEGGRCVTQGGVEEKGKMKTSKVKKSSSAGAKLNESGGDFSGGNTNKSIQSEILLNPKTLEALSKKQLRLLDRCAAVAGVTPKDYLEKINCKSPEWKWM